METNQPQTTETGLPPPGNDKAVSELDDKSLIQKYESEFRSLDRRSSRAPRLFHEEDPVFKSVIPSTTHWSVAWSDLMMTMFVLFLCMFVYQAAHKDFLVSNEPEIIGGMTTEALEVGDNKGAYLPKDQESAGLPLLTGGTVRKAESVKIEDTDTYYLGQGSEEARDQIERSIREEEDRMISERVKNDLARVEGIMGDLPVETVELDDIRSTDPGFRDQVPRDMRLDLIAELLTADRKSLQRNNLEEFATIKILPEKTVSITLRGDQLFAAGSAELTKSALSSLGKIGSVIGNTPYMINVVGHMDNAPMHSKKYPSNWELSVSRASAVARFFIERIGMNPSQFVVSGYSSYRPVVPNTNTGNRALNRRVEIIVSKRLPSQAEKNN